MLAKFRFRSRQSISASLAYFPPFIYAASRDGYVYGLRDERGRKRWQFSAGNPVVERPVVIDDAIAIRSMMNLCLSFDHRILDGATAGRFLQSVRRRLESWGPSDGRHADDPARRYRSR